MYISFNGLRSISFNIRSFEIVRRYEIFCPCYPYLRGNENYNEIKVGHYSRL